MTKENDFRENKEVGIEESIDISENIRIISNMTREEKFRQGYDTSRKENHSKRVQRRKRELMKRRRRRKFFSLMLVLAIVAFTVLLDNSNIFSKTVRGNEKAVVNGVDASVTEKNNNGLNKEASRQQLIVEAEKLKQGYYIDEAIVLLESNSKLINEEITKKIEECKAYKESFVKYDGPVEHIFFHSLIVYPELAFDNFGHDAGGYNMWFNTVDEFKKMLPLLKEKGYVLMDITEIFQKNDNGEMVKQDIFLPEGKKPLIISQDDVNYYDYMKPDGFADRLVLDDNNQVSTLVRNLDGQESITRDGDIVPILDDYIKENPDFSYRGAKGILAVTGYEGILGYRLDSEGNKEEAKKVVERLKETGWRFANHSYTHNGGSYFGDNPQYDKVEYDFNAWNTRIEPITGKTNIFIAPFGVTLKGENYKIAEKYGFEIYCNVSRSTNIDYRGGSVVTPRFNIDGYTFFKVKESINERFFDVDKVIDKSRPDL